MNVLIIMVPIALLLGFTFLFAFIWATKNGQFDDLVTPAHRMLEDDGIAEDGLTGDNRPEDNEEIKEHKLKGNNINQSTQKEGNHVI